MRVAVIAAVGLVLGYGPTVAQDTSSSSSTTVDRIFANYGYVTVVMRVKNASDTPVEAIRVVCDVFATDGSALAIAHAKMESVPGGATVAGEAVAKLPPGSVEPSSAKCRVTS